MGLEKWPGAKSRVLEMPGEEVPTYSVGDKMSQKASKQVTTQNWTQGSRNSKMTGCSVKGNCQRWSLTVLQDGGGGFRESSSSQPSALPTWLVHLSTATSARTRFPQQLTSSLDLSLSKVWKSEQACLPGRRHSTDTCHLMVLASNTCTHFRGTETTASRFIIAN